MDVHEWEKDDVGVEVSRLDIKCHKASTPSREKVLVAGSKEEDCTCFEGDIVTTKLALGLSRDPRRSLEKDPHCGR